MNEKSKRTFQDGIRLAQQIANEIAQEWQKSEHPDWSGGVEAAKQIEKRLGAIAAPVVGPKCAICHNEARSFLWQPSLQSLYLPGSHIRGFVAIAIGDACIQRMQSGETLSFSHRGATYQADRRGFVEQEVQA
jgi:hypothetical protein